MIISMQCLGISPPGAAPSYEKSRIHVIYSLTWRCIFIGVSLE